MARPITLFTGQWADMPLADLAPLAANLGYDGLELACWGDHVNVPAVANDPDEARKVVSLLDRHHLSLHAIGAHLIGQAVCDPIDERHREILPARLWGDGEPEGVRTRAAKEMVAVARAARNLGVDTVTGFTGSRVWGSLYAFPPTSQAYWQRGFDDFAERWGPILDAFDEVGVNFALEVHPTEIAFDTATAERALEAVEHHPRFGFNYDPSHLAYQDVDYVAFIRRFKDRIMHVHMKDVWWGRGDGSVGTFGGHMSFGDPRRAWDFRSIGRGDVDFEAIMAALADIGYDGPLSVEWEDSRMDRVHGAREAAQRVRALDFASPKRAFDAAFAQEEDA